MSSELTDLAPGGRMTCETCLRSRATDADDAAYETWMESADADPNATLPDGWLDAEGSHLCWVEYGGECRPPEWWHDVTPAEVQGLRAELAETRAEIAAARALLDVWGAAR